MSVAYILDRVGKKLGINPNDNHQRSIMLGYLNEGAQELYEESDMVGSLVEQVSLEAVQPHRTLFIQQFGAG